MSIEELKLKISLKEKALADLKKELDERTRGDLGYLGKYLGIQPEYAADTDNVTYIKCTDCGYRDDPGSGLPCIYLKGIGFSSTFSEYEDLNHAKFSTWIDFWIPRWKLEHGEASIVEISEKVYLENFGMFLAGIHNTLDEWIK